MSKILSYAELIDSTLAELIELGPFQTPRGERQIIDDGIGWSLRGPFGWLRRWACRAGAVADIKAHLRAEYPNRDKLAYAGRYSPHPVYSLFSCSPAGEWGLLAYGGMDIVLAKYQEILAQADFTGGLEFRCDGSRVDV